MDPPADADADASSSLCCLACGFAAEFCDNGVLMACPTCQMAFYCSLQCQQWDYTRKGGHSNVCRRRAAAAAAVQQRVENVGETKQTTITTTQPKNLQQNHPQQQQQQQQQQRPVEVENNNNDGVLLETYSSCYSSMDDYDDLFDGFSESLANKEKEESVDANEAKKAIATVSAAAVSSSSLEPFASPIHRVESQQPYVEFGQDDDDYDESQSFHMEDDDDELALQSIMEEDEEPSEEPDMEGSWRSREPFSVASGRDDDNNNNNNDKEQEELLVLQSMYDITSNNTNTNSSNNSNSNSNSSSSSLQHHSHANVEHMVQTILQQVVSTVNNNNSNMDSDSSDQSSSSSTCINSPAMDASDGNFGNFFSEEDDGEDDDDDSSEARSDDLRSVEGQLADDSTGRTEDTELLAAMPPSNHDAKSRSFLALSAEERSVTTSGGSEDLSFFTRSQHSDPSSKQEQQNTSSINSNSKPAASVSAQQDQNSSNTINKQSLGVMLSRVAARGHPWSGANAPTSTPVLSAPAKNETCDASTATALEADLSTMNESQPGFNAVSDQKQQDSQETQDNRAVQSGSNPSTLNVSSPNPAKQGISSRMVMTPDVEHALSEYKAKFGNEASQRFEHQLSRFLNTLEDIEGGQTDQGRAEESDMEPSHTSNSDSSSSLSSESSTKSNETQLEKKATGRSLSSEAVMESASETDGSRVESDMLESEDAFRNYSPVVVRVFAHSSMTGSKSRLDAGFGVPPPLTPSSSFSSADAMNDNDSSLDRSIDDGTSLTPGKDFLPLPTADMVASKPVEKVVIDIDNTATAPASGHLHFKSAPEAPVSLVVNHVSAARDTELTLTKESGFGLQPILMTRSLSQSPEYATSGKLEGVAPSMVVGESNESSEMSQTAEVSDDEQQEQEYTDGMEAEECDKLENASNASTAAPTLDESTMNHSPVVVRVSSYAKETDTSSAEAGFGILPFFLRSFSSFSGDSPATSNESFDVRSVATNQERDEQPPKPLIEVGPCILPAALLSDERQAHASLPARGPQDRNPQQGDDHSDSQKSQSRSPPLKPGVPGVSSAIAPSICNENTASDNTNERGVRQLNTNNDSLEEDDTSPVDMVATTNAINAAVVRLAGGARQSSYMFGDSISSSNSLGMYDGTTDEAALGNSAAAVVAAAYVASSAPSPSIAELAPGERPYNASHKVKSKSRDAAKPSLKSSMPSKSKVLPVVEPSERSLAHSSSDPESNLETAMVDKTYNEKEVTGTTGDEKAMPTKQDSYRRKVIQRIVFVLLLLVVPLIIGLEISLAGKNRSSEAVVSGEGTLTPTVSPGGGVATFVPTSNPNNFSEQEQQLFSVIAPVTADMGESMTVAGSPQNQALVWLASSQSALSLEPARQIQRYALATFFYSTKGGSWSVNTLWLSSMIHECLWFSRSNVPCNEFGQYIDLSLGFNSVGGVIPPEIGLLTNLRSLSLSGGTDIAIGGTLPSEIGRLTNLLSLSVRSNKLQGTLPLSLSSLTAIQLIDMASNQFSGTIDSSLTTRWSSTLRELDLSSNQFRGTLPDVSLLIGLERLTVNSNKFTGRVTDSIGELQNLRELTLFQNQLTALPDSLGQLSNLEVFSAGENQLAGSLSPILLSGLTSLRILVLARNLLTGSIPSQIGVLTNLRYLDASFNRLQGPIPTDIGNLGDLVDLQLQSNVLSGRLPDEIANLSRVGLLRMDNNNLTGSVPSAVCDVFAGSLPVFYLDCDGVLPEVACPTDLCCTYCCSDNAFGSATITANNTITTTTTCSCVYQGTDLEFLC